MENLILRNARLTDLGALVKIEQAAFDADRLSERRFKHHIQFHNSELLLAENPQGVCLGYGLVLYHQGTRLARLYSLAVDKAARGQGVARALLAELERLAADNERHYMRLEVSAGNESAIRLYESCGYRAFGEYRDYYEDHQDALRMHKRIRLLRSAGVQREIPWYPQSTEFTCGPAALMMGLASLNTDIAPSINLELDIWRQATTIFMTSGHGGCHPFGLALAARSHEFHATVWLNTDQPLFIDGVRSEHKKHIMTEVHEHFLDQCREAHIPIHYQALDLDAIERSLKADCAVLILISTYRLDGRKSPHWVIVTGMDEHCLFVHDPDTDLGVQNAMDCQNVPVARADFDKMAAFGTQRIRAALVVAAN